MNLSTSTSRRTFLDYSACTLASITSLSASEPSMAAYLSAAQQPKPQRVRFPVDDVVIVGNLYLPADYRVNNRYPAVAVGGSLTSVKEMMGGTYASELSKRGIVAMAIDYRHYGESGGEPRQYENPEAKAADLSAAAAYLGSRADVRPGAIGLLGVCTSGGNVLYTAARDKNIRALATVAGHFAEPSVIASVPVYGGREAIEKHRTEGRAARAKYEQTGENMLIPCYHDTDRTAAHIGPMEYYLDKTRGGGVPQWKNAFAVMSWEPWLDFDPVKQAPSVSTPTLIVHSDGCVMPGQARKVYELLNGPKRLRWTSGDHFLFYDDAEKIAEAADAVAEHFHKYLG